MCCRCSSYQYNAKKAVLPFGVSLPYWISLDRPCSRHVVRFIHIVRHLACVLFLLRTRSVCILYRVAKSRFCCLSQGSLCRTYISQRGSEGGVLNEEQKSAVCMPCHVVCTHTLMSPCDNGLERLLVTYVFASVPDCDFFNRCTLS